MGIATEYLSYNYALHKPLYCCPLDMTMLYLSAPSFDTHVVLPSRLFSAEYATRVAWVSQPHHAPTWRINYRSAASRCHAAHVAPRALTFTACV